MKKTEIVLQVNGKKQLIMTDPTNRLLDILREDLHLPGTKEGCSIGECGACTVIMNGKPVNSCLVLAGQADGSEILTIEGIEGDDGRLHPIQEAFIEADAVQCGYCTPGMILSAMALLKNRSRPNDSEIKEAISGNLCRCSGYKQIVEAVHIAAGKMEK